MNVSIDSSGAYGTEMVLTFTDGTAFAVLSTSKQVTTIRHYVVESDTVLYERSELNTELPSLGNEKSTCIGGCIQEG
jgi:hypothetical protein